jgi:hypothetical protein
MSRLSTRPGRRGGSLIVITMRTAALIGIAALVLNVGYVVYGLRLRRNLERLTAACDKEELQLGRLTVGWDSLAGPQPLQQKPPETGAS